MWIMVCMIFQKENERYVHFSTRRFQFFTFILLLYGLQLTTCLEKNGTEFDNLPTEISDTVTVNVTALVTDFKHVLPDTVRDVNIMKWIQETPEKITKRNLAFLPGLAILCFLVVLCFKCCGWFREHVKDRHMFEDNDYVIVTEEDNDFMNVDFRSDTASSIYYDTITSYYSFIRHNNSYDTVTSYRSLNLKCDKRYNAENSCRSFLQKVIEMKDEEVQTDSAVEEGRRQKKINQQMSTVHGKRYGRFEVVPSDVNFENETTIRNKQIEKKPILASKDHIMRCFSVGARSTPTSLRKLQKFKVSFDMDGEVDQYNTLPARSTFVVAADVEARRDRRIKSMSRETIPFTIKTVNKARSIIPRTSQQIPRNVMPLSLENTKNPDDNSMINLQISPVNNDEYSGDLERANDLHYSRELHNTERNKAKDNASINIPQSLCGLYHQTNFETHKADKQHVDRSLEKDQPNIQENGDVSYDIRLVEEPLSPASMSSSENSLDGNQTNGSCLSEKYDVTLRDEPRIDVLTNGSDKNSPNHSTSNVPAKYVYKHLENVCFYSSPSHCSDSCIIETYPVEVDSE